MRLACLTPLPPSETGIADYSAALLPILARHAAVDIFSGDTSSLASASGTLPVYPLARFESDAAHYDRVLYQMGNGPEHGALYDLLLEHPGVVVLHDGTLHHFYVDRTLHRGDAPAYLREMAYAHGAEGYEAALQIVRGAAIYPFYRFPLLSRVLDCATGVIVHGETVRAAVSAARPGAQVRVVEHFAFPAVPARRTRGEMLGRLGLPPDAFVVASFGNIGPDKRGAALVSGFAAFAGREPRARLVFVGRRVAEYDLAAETGRLGLAPRVRWAGRVPASELPDYLALADIVVNLRSPTSGEASGAVMRTFAYGKPTLVSDAGWFAELPREVVLHVPVGPGEEQEIAAALTRLAADPSAREGYRRAALEFAAAHSIDRAAEEYIQFLT